MYPKMKSQKYKEHQNKEADNWLSTVLKKSSDLEVMMHNINANANLPSYVNYSYNEEGEEEGDDLEEDEDMEESMENENIDVTGNEEETENDGKETGNDEDEAEENEGEAFEIDAEDHEENQDVEEPEEKVSQSVESQGEESQGEESQGEESERDENADSFEEFEDSEEDGEEEEDEKEEEEEEEEERDVLNLDEDFVPPNKIDSLEEMYQQELLEKEMAEQAETQEENKDEPEAEDEQTDTLEELKAEYDDAMQGKSKIELMITFYEHRLAHCCSIKKRNAVLSEPPPTQVPGSDGDKKTEGPTLKMHVMGETTPMDDDEQLAMRFKHLLKNLEKLRKETMDTTIRLNDDINNELEVNDKIQGEVEANILKFNLERREVAKAAIFQENNRTIDMKEIEDHERQEAMSVKELVRLRVQNIHLRNTLSEKEREVKHGVDFEEMEQMKLQNQIIQEKIEHKQVNNEHVRKGLIRKVGAITHIKQKTGTCVLEAEAARQQCKQKDDNIRQLKEELTKLRQKKELLRRNIELQKRDNGILGQDVLLRDMENQFDIEKAQEVQLEALKSQQAKLLDQTENIQNRIRKFMA